MVQFTWYKFSDLNVEQLYKILAMRSDIFVVEQHCVYLDPDGKDLYSMHLMGEENNSLVAYMRLFPPTETENFILFGRVITARSARSKGYGKKLMQALLAYCHKHYPGISIQCSAQFYLKKFYESFGLKAVGEVYQEDGIPHIYMRKE